MNKNKLFGITLGIIAVVLAIITAVSVQAETRYMSGTFKYGAYAPVVRIWENNHTNWVLQQRPDGVVEWAKPKEKDSQYFVILPTDDGYYFITAFGRPYDILTFGKDSKGRAKVTMEYPSVAPKYDWEQYKPGDNQKFKIVWYASRNKYRLKCKAGNASVPIFGWGDLRIEQVNA